MTLMRILVRHVGYRSYLAYQGESGILSEYKRSLPLWTADREVPATRKLVALKAMLIHAGATSLYYRGVFQRAGFNRNYEKVKELTCDKSGKYRWFINELSRKTTAN